MQYNITCGYVICVKEFNFFFDASIRATFFLYLCVKCVFPVTLNCFVKIIVSCFIVKYVQLLSLFIINHAHNYITDVHIHLCKTLNIQRDLCVYTEHIPAPPSQPPQHSHSSRLPFLTFLSRSGKKARKINDPRLITISLSLSPFSRGGKASSLHAHSGGDSLPLLLYRACSQLRQFSTPERRSFLSLSLARALFSPRAKADRTHTQRREDWVIREDDKEVVCAPCAGCAGAGVGLRGIVREEMRVAGSVLCTRRC